MANTSSAIKKIRVDERRKKLNDARKVAYKEALKEVKQAVSKNDAKAASAALPKAFKLIDKAAQKNTIHSGKADRLKSRLAKAIAKVSK